MTVVERVRAIVIPLVLAAGAAAYLRSGGAGCGGGTRCSPGDPTPYKSCTQAIGSPTSPDCAGGEYCTPLPNHPLADGGLDYRCFAPCSRGLSCPRADQVCTPSGFFCLITNDGGFDGGDGGAADGGDGGYVLAPCGSANVCYPTVCQ